MALFVSPSPITGSAYGVTAYKTRVPPPLVGTTGIATPWYSLAPPKRDEHHVHSLRKCYPATPAATIVL